MLLPHGWRDDESGQLLARDFVFSIAESPLGSGIEFKHSAFLVDGNNAIQRSPEESGFTRLANAKLSSACFRW
jgi:hypothetical protein